KQEITNSMKYNGACVFALVGDSEMALSLLNDLVTHGFYSDYGHLSTDSDLVSLHDLPGWNPLLEKVKINKQTAPERFKKKVKDELSKAKEILTADGGKLWGESLWNENVLVMDDENNIYSLQKFADAISDDGVLFYKKIKDGELSYTNTSQQFQGKDWATIRADYIGNNFSETIIHELFHLYHFQKIKLKGLIVEYLDETHARTLLRIEFAALRNALTKINEGADKKIVAKYLEDAMLFRQYRQNKYAEFLPQALDLENVEGLANYTGVRLSANPNKISHAIKEIDSRESAKSLSRAFPYATGLAYGLIFDYLNIDWRSDLTHVYDFLSIYETKFLHKKLSKSKLYLAEVEARNNGKKIIDEESKREKENVKIESFYRKQFIENPTLQLTLEKGAEISLSYDMNSTFSLKGNGVVYTQIKGGSANEKGFGNFSTITGKEGLGVSGILITSDLSKINFPKPIKIEDNKIIGETYEINLNKGWKVISIDKIGNLKIIKDE
ncbi:MAG TPA: hypothetical protein PKY82_19070, partial [Pyrinomonadaceae bacterium]|nr:hypothetical protein [Pyrinomonadaceae bacterium]